MFEVPIGTKEEKDKGDASRAFLWFLVWIGIKEYHIPLNGGSETRRDLIKDYKMRFRSCKEIEIVSSSCYITIRKRRT